MEVSSTKVTRDQQTDGQPLHQALGCLDQLLACTGDELGGRWGCLAVERLRCLKAFVSFSEHFGMDRNEIKQQKSLIAEKQGDQPKLRSMDPRMSVDFGNFSHSSPIGAAQILSHTQMKQEMQQLCPKSACCSVLEVKTKVGRVLSGSRLVESCDWLADWR